MFTPQFGQTQQSGAMGQQQMPANNLAALYQSALGRAPDDAGMSFYQSALDGGSSFDMIRNDIMGSAEAGKFSQSQQQQQQPPQQNIFDQSQGFYTQAGNVFSGLAGQTQLPQIGSQNVQAGQYSAGQTQLPQIGPQNVQAGQYSDSAMSGPGRQRQIGNIFDQSQGFYTQAGNVFSGLAGQTQLPQIGSQNVQAGQYSDSAMSGPGRQRQIGNIFDQSQGFLRQSGDMLNNIAARPPSAPVEAGDVRAGQVSETDLNPYMNPFTSGVIDTTMSELNRQRQIAMNQTNSAASGAFGGSRQGVMQAETNRGFGDIAARTAAGLNSDNFMQAQGAAFQDIANTLSADQGNQSAKLQSSLANAQNSLAANQQSTQNASALANVADMGFMRGQSALDSDRNAAFQNIGNTLSADQRNQSAQLEAQLANARNSLSTNQQRSQNASYLAGLSNMGFTRGQSALDSDRNAAFQNIGNTLSADQRNQSAQLEAQQANARNSLAALDMDRNTAFQNIGNTLSADQRNQSAQLEAQLANARNSLSTNQQRSQNASYLAGLSNMGFTRGQSALDAQMGAGNMQQGLIQQIIDLAKDQTMADTNFSDDALSRLLAAIGGVPSPVSEESKSTPGLLDIASIFL